MDKKSLFSNRILVIYFIALTSFVVSACKPNIDKLKSEGDIDGLIAALSYECEEGESYIRRNASEALADLVNESHVEIFLDILANENLYCAHSHAIYLLGEIGDERAFVPLIEILENGADSFVIEALGKIGDVRAIEPILQTLDNADSWSISSAALVLANFGDARAVDLSIGLLNDNNESIIFDAISTLKEIGDERAFEPLINLYGAISDVQSKKNMKNAVLEALLELEYSEKSIEPIINIISSGIDRSDDDQLLYGTILEISLKIGKPLVEQIIYTYGYKMSDLPYASPEVVPLRDSLVELVRLHYGEICKDFATANYQKNSVYTAAIYIPKTSGLNKMILINRDFTPHVWIENLPKELAPVSVNETELIFILDKAIAYPTGRVCLIANSSNKDEIYYAMKVQVFKAMDGTLLHESEIETPRQCGRISGEPFSFDDFWKWWIKQLEQEALEQEILSKRPDLSLNEFTIEEIANEGLHEYTVSSYKRSELVDEYNASIEIKFAEREVCLTKNGETSCLIRVGENEYTSSDGMMYMALSIDGFFIMNSDREATGSETYFSLIDE
jgi:HEAT repeat protein